ncbi:hypothetical protein H4Q26_003793 [Puccinia striiformis f. sp. tritici PST-130]|nr:hypothetical protein H4Q26_003793 [Puccinia striiformis f. sp. tritici PST-130]
MPLLEEPTNSLHVNSALISTLIDFPENTLKDYNELDLQTVSEIILISPESLKSQTGLSIAEVEEVYRRLSAILTQSRQMFGSQQSETGGIPVGLLTEIVGESGSGKTCLSLQLSLNVQLPFHCVVLMPLVFIFAPSRGFLLPDYSKWLLLYQIDSMLRYNQVECGESYGNFHLTRVLDPESLLSMVHYSLPIFLDRHNNPTNNDKIRRKNNQTDE